MNKSYTIAGIGVCLGKRPGFEALAESVITGTPIADKELPDSLELAIREAMRYTDRKALPIVTDTQAPGLGAQQVCGSFRKMLEAAPENALLLSRRENGWMAIALTQQDSGLARVEITGGENTDGDGFLRFLLSALEIRYALHLDDRSQLYRFWDAQAQREKQIHCGGLCCSFTEPKVLASRVYDSKKYLLPIVFTTVQEAKRKLNALKQSAGLHTAMAALLPELDKRTDSTNTIVLLADSKESLAADIDELLTKADRLLDEGFCWRSRSGSRYIRRSCADPKVVFMNSPGGMFNAKPFYNFFFKHYITLDKASRFETDRLLTGAEDKYLSRALFDMVVNHTVTSLLSEMGIESDIRSGACQGELSIEFPHMKDAAGNLGKANTCLDILSGAIEMAMRGDAEPLEAYLNRKIDKFTKYYLKCDRDKVRNAAEKYDSVFVWITGSVEDVIVAGEQAACLRLIKELGCVSTEMGDPLYIHTPIMEPYRQEIRQRLLDAGLHLDVEQLPFKLFSTYYRTYMTSSPEMLADNLASLIIDEVDYASAVQTLYADGGRVFIDLSTMQVCDSWAKATLKPHADASVLSIFSGADAAADLLNMAAVMLSGNVRFDHRKLLGKLNFPKDRESIPVPEKKEGTPMVKTTAPAATPVNAPVSGEDFARILQRQMMNNEQAFKLYMNAQNALYEQLLGTPVQSAPAPAPTRFPNASKTCLYNREQVITMTDTSMSAVLGDQYKEVDQYPVRARMPLPPFLFVSRIMSIDAEYGVFRPSSIVTEFDLDEDCVFRNGDSLICPLVASEASHIAIFLIGYMGLDAISKGTLSYRAIDSSMTAYSERPFRVGDTLRTVLKINRFVKNGSTTLLFFTFESYNGDELIFITEATGGFFTKADLASNKGVINPRKQLRKNVEPKEFLHLSDSTKTSYDKEEMAAFYRGDYETCFGVKPKPTRKEMYYLPYDMKMVDRVTNIDYNGGIYGRGLICGEKQITPDLWPFKAHFKNDPVFPAIIVSDGVTQLGMFLFAHAGLLNKFDNASFTSVVGNCVKSRFRGQVRHGYSTLRYEVNIKELVETDEYINLFFDAMIFNDDVQIMQIDSYALKISNAAD